MLKLFVSILFLLFTTPFLRAQVSINESYDIKVLMENYIKQNKSKEAIDGWRIQVYTTTDRERIQNQLYRFQSLFPDMKAEWFHQTPYYNIRAGAFVTELECIQALNKIKETFTSASAVKDKLKPEEIY